MKKGILWCVFPALAVFLTGCAVENNYMRPEDFPAYLERDGVKIEGVRSLSPAPFMATSGVGIMIAGSEIGVYKYDRMSDIQKQRIDHIGKTGRVYLNGIPYPVVTHGSFMFFGLDKNTQKRNILKTIQKFD